MKKGILYVLAAVIIIIQIILIFQISLVRTEITNTHNHINNTNHMISGQVSSAIWSLQQTLNEETRLLESAETVLGDFNIDTLQVDVGFTVVPREMTPDAAIFLDFDGTTVPMTQDAAGITFRATVPFDLNARVNPLVIIYDGDTIRSSQDDRLLIWNIRSSLFPDIHPFFSGTVTSTRNRLTIDGRLEVNIRDGMSDFTDYRLIVSLGDTVISDEQLEPERFSFNWVINKTIDNPNNEILSMTLIATHASGLIHEFDIWPSWRQSPPDVGGFGSTIRREVNERIFAPDGRLLWTNVTTFQW